MVMLKDALLTLLILATPNFFINGNEEKLKKATLLMHLEIEKMTFP